MNLYIILAFLQSFAYADQTIQFQAVGVPVTGATIHIMEDDLAHHSGSDILKYYSALQIPTKTNADGSIGKEFFSVPHHLIGGFSGGCSYFPGKSIDCTLFAFNSPSLKNVVVTVDPKDKTVSLAATDQDAALMNRFFSSDASHALSASYLNGSLAFSGSPTQFELKWKSPPPPTPSPSSAKK